MLKFFSLLLLSASVSANPYNFTITRVIDGDTVEINAPFLPPELKQKLSIRVYGVDTPEKGFRAHCKAEADSGLSATEFTKRLVNQSKSYQIIIHDWDKYGGRVLGDIILDGKSLRESLIEHKLARPYFGEKKESWCDLP